MVEYSKALGAAFAARRAYLGMGAEELRRRVGEAWGLKMQQGRWSRIETGRILEGPFSPRSLTPERMAQVCSILGWTPEQAAEAARIIGAEGPSAGDPA